MSKQTNNDAKDEKYSLRQTTVLQRAAYTIQSTSTPKPTANVQTTGN